MYERLVIVLISICADCLARCQLPLAQSTIVGFDPTQQPACVDQSQIDHREHDSALLASGRWLHPIRFAHNHRRN